LWAGCAAVKRKRREGGFGCSGSVGFGAHRKISSLIRDEIVWLFDAPWKREVYRKSERNLRLDADDC
jgi:hypothetical protein